MTLVGDAGWRAVRCVAEIINAIILIAVDSGTFSGAIIALEAFYGHYGAAVENIIGHYVRAALNSSSLCACTQLQLF